MSEPRHVALASTSNSEDAAWLAVADVAGVATDLGIDYRLIGGNSVALLVQVHDAATQVPGRATADADMGASFEVCADPRLVPALTALGYDRQSGNRFTRTQGTRALVIDVLAPSYLGRLIPNQTHGDLVLDEIPGLLAALLLPPVNVAAQSTFAVTEPPRDAVGGLGFGWCRFVAVLFWSTSLWPRLPVPPERPSCFRLVGAELDLSCR